MVQNPATFLMSNKTVATDVVGNSYAEQFALFEPTMSPIKHKSRGFPLSLDCVIEINCFMSA